MRIDYLSPDILLFRGDSLAALATAFIDGRRVLLVDALASEYDAIEMRDYLERDLGLRVESILLTRTGKRHEAGLHVFPTAAIAVASATAPSLHWGRHRLDFLQAPGDPARALALEVAAEQLLFVRERVVGAVALIGESEPGQVDAALAWLAQRGARRIIPATAGAQDADALGHARAYLAKLGATVRRQRAAGHSIASITLEECLPDGVFAGSLESHWHADNLKRIAERGLFMVPAPAPARKAAAARGEGGGVLATLLCMLGRLARSGV